MSGIASEEWRSAPGYEGFYEVSNTGRIRSRRRKGSRGGIKAIRAHRSGYIVTDFWVDGRTHVVRVHTLVALAFLGPRPSPEIHIRHLDGDKANNAVSNLRYGTARENQLDEVRLGRHSLARRTHCPNGHEFSETNTRVRGGTRTCRACCRENTRRYNERRRARAMGAHIDEPINH